MGFENASQAYGMADYVFVELTLGICAFRIQQGL
jgi:hypothetical protein